MRFVFSSDTTTHSFYRFTRKEEKMNASIKEEILGQRIRVQRMRLGMMQEKLTAEQFLSSGRQYKGAMAYKRKEAENTEGLFTSWKKKFLKYDEGMQCSLWDFIHLWILRRKRRQYIASAPSCR